MSAHEISAAPPQNLEAEQAVLGAVLLSDAAMASLQAADLRPEHFYRDSHARVYAAMLALHRRGEPVDRLTVVAELKRVGELELAGGPGAIELLASAVPNVSGVSAYARLVRESYAQRQLRELALRVAAAPDDPAAVAALEEATRNARHGASRVGPVLRVLDTHEMLTTEPPRVEWIVEDFAARDQLTLLVGREKQGKSMLCLGLGVGVASGGVTVAGIDCSAGKVLVVDAENGKGGIHRRVRQLGLSLADKKNLTFVEARGFDLRRDLSALEELLEEHRPDMTILDSWRSLWGGDENDNAVVAACIDPLRELARAAHTAVVLIHHMGKNGSGYRGATALGASVENLLEFARVDDDPDRLRRRLRVVGFRHAEEPMLPRWLSVENERGKIFLERAEPFGDEDLEPASNRRRLRDRLVVPLRELLTDEPQTLKDICLALGRSPKDGTVRRVLDDLAAQGVAVQTDDGWILAPVPGATCELAPGTASANGVGEVPSETPALEPVPGAGALKGVALGTNAVEPNSEPSAVEGGTDAVEPNRLEYTIDLRHVSDDAGEAFIAGCIEQFDAEEI